MAINGFLLNAFNKLLAAFVVVLLVFATRSVAAAEAKKFSSEDMAFYQKNVKPILVANCMKCHGAKPKVKGGLNMAGHVGLRQGGDTGPAINLDNPSKSLLLTAISYKDDNLEMPPKGKLPQSEIDVLTKWVEMGSPMPEGEAETHEEGIKPPQINAQTRSHWSFNAVKKPAVPNVKNAKWLRNPIDAFILARLETNGLVPNTTAAKATLIRRAYFDLIGLPPTPKRVDAFVKNNSPTAYEELIDELLEMPQYGEKWARHWLDLVHYAESNSFERDNPKPEVWRYRDYVIRSFNSDKPYDQFVREQLAGDELEEVTPDSIMALGYYRLGLWDDESADPPQSRFDELDDWVTVTGQVMLGLTMDCARCHDHKLDPIPQADYYRFVSFFRDVKSFQNGRDGMSKGFAGGNFHVKLSDFIPADQLKQGGSGIVFNNTELERLNADLTRLEATISARLPGGVVDDFKYESNRIDIVKKNRNLFDKGVANRYIKLATQRDKLKKSRDAKDVKVLAIRAEVTPPATHVMVRGNPSVPGKEVSPGFPQILSFDDPKIAAPKPGQRSAGRRIVLANWITNPKNPLTARVAVNRIWQHHFGRGLVESTSNFGLTGTKPTHPQLLDWLASDFVNNGWSIKKLHKQIMLSNTYRMASTFNAVAFDKDPKNDLMWGFNMRRLTAEEIRDTILAVNGTLNPDMFGPSIFPSIPREILAGQSRPGANWRTSNERDQARRSVYIHVKRSLTVPMIESFDGADTDNTCPVRFVTTQPTQALGMMNSDFMAKQAAKLAERLKKEFGTNPRDQVAAAIELATQRKAKDSDVQRGVKLIESLKKQENINDDLALTYYCLMVYNLNEFMYLD